MISDLPDGYSFGNNPLNPYDFHVTVPIAANSWANRIVTPITLPVGILRRILVFFPPGVNTTVRSNIYHGLTQLVPIDPVGAGLGTYYLTGDSYMWDLFNSFVVINAAGVAFTLNSWNTASLGNIISSSHIIDYYFLVEQIPVP